jgi:outer membrane immunogenic protein
MTFRLIHLAAPAASFAALAAAVPAAAQDQGDPWAGWYVGANLGANWGDSSISGTVLPGTGAILVPPSSVAVINAVGRGSSNKTEFTGGIEGGYNYRIGNWLLGVETDFVALNVDDRKTLTVQSTLLTTPPLVITNLLDQRATTNWMWSLRPRVGYVFGPLLVYGTAGIATSNIKVALGFSDNLVPQNVVLSENSETKTGWIAGLGAGYALNPRVSVKGEYLYADFGSISTTAFSPTSLVNLSSEAKVKSNILRVGLDYRF